MKSIEGKGKSRMTRSALTLEAIARVFEGGLREMILFIITIAGFS